mgnify:CR=1 FL=1
MLKKMCILYVEGKIVSKHIIPEVKYGDKGFYRDTVSINAFSERENKRFYNSHLKGEILDRRVFVQNYKEWLSENKEYNLDETPIFEHQNIKEFYSFIDYNVKKKKYN